MVGGAGHGSLDGVSPRLAAAAIAVVAILALGGCVAAADPPMTPSEAGTSSDTEAGQAWTGMTTGPATPGAPITVLPPPTTSPVEAPASSIPVISAGTDPNPALESTPATEAETASGRDSEPATAPTDLSGAIVVIDPGHNGGNAAHPEIVDQQVPAGFGQTKPCNTTGTATDAGYPEHALNWAVAGLVREGLEAQGVTVIMTRDSDDGVGPCVDQRAAIGNDADADAVVSIHGDGAAPDTHGFFVMTASRTEATKRTDRQTVDLSVAIRDAMVAAGFTASSTLGADGLWARGDLAGLNLSLRPTVMIELGNMRNPAEAKRLTSARGQQRYAAALAAGVTAFLLNR